MDSDMKIGHYMKEVLKNVQPCNWGDKGNEEKL